ncbi:unnamed protein product [Triticum turgidum subsp. durum]|uniref:Mannan endo-1,4-beta-mannosidase n=1 Tax=Triticum turgidum subsp. durum TaxID=4567 RepID=A0A9R0UTI3_TRITD|nr:unnamed protein product [Triticum turgidum subsp. durum]
MAVQPPNPASPVPLVRAANLGGWLVTEGWILPSLFDGIPNNDLRDDTQLQFRSVTQNAFIAAENGGGAALVANRASAFGWESFKLGRIDTNTFNFKVFNDQFVTIAGVNAVATAAMAGKTEMFQLLHNDVDKNRMRIRAPNGSFLQWGPPVSITLLLPRLSGISSNTSCALGLELRTPPWRRPGAVRHWRWLGTGTAGQPRLLELWKRPPKLTEFPPKPSANKDGSMTANFGKSTTWGDDDPSVFVVTIVNWVPSIFDGIPNKDLLVSNNQFVTVSGVNVVATASAPGQTETFQLVRSYGDKNRMRIRASNGSFLQANKDGSVTANFGESTTWGDNDPSVFAVNIVNGPQGEYQICNGYGKDMATQVMNNHWSTYIVETDFAFMAANSLNAVRIPVGWWIASDPNPPAPFVGGSLQALDIAFTWAERHNIHVIIDLHAAPGSQNPDAHSGGRDGSQTWGDSQIAQTVQVIDFLAARYAKRSSLLAVELMNEPVAPGVSLDSLKTYYQQGYNAVRRHSLTAYVIMSNRLSGFSLELLDFASQFNRVVLDMHYYALFDKKFDSFTVQDNIDYFNNFIASEINAINRPDGPLTFVGEWVAEWQVKDATKEDFQRFANAQMAVYRKATFGWAYWTYKNVNNHWSMQWMMDPYISLGNA